MGDHVIARCVFMSMFVFLLAKTLREQMKTLLKLSEYNPLV